jgi:hypothetical protein
MKYKTLLIIASCTKVLAWIAVVIGVFSSIRIGIIATTPLASVSFLLGGLLITAIFALMLLAASKFIHLFVDMQKDLSEIADSIKKKEFKKEE